MDHVARLDPQDRSDLFRAAAEQRGLTVGIIEKDFWLCWVLRRIYTHWRPPVQIHFKGGTSLSKVFHVIERMSEDVDLVIDRKDLGFTGPKNPTNPGLSNKARQRLVEEIKVTARDFVRAELKPSLDRAFSESLGVTAGSGTWSTAFAHDDPDDQTILFRYPTIEVPSAYLRASVRLELGARGDPWPSVEGVIRPYVADEFPTQFAEAATKLPLVVSAERTFWEKVTILHMLHHQPEGKPLNRRMARHYYDTYCLAKHDLGRRAIADTDLLSRVVEHKTLFFPRAWARYDLAQPGSLRLTPPVHSVAQLRNDYDQMAGEMMFGEVPDFDSLTEALKEVEKLANTRVRP